MSASQNGHKEIVELLIEKGAEVDLIDQKGRTALTYASLRESQEIVQLLLDNGASADRTDNNGWSALVPAIIKR